MDSSNSRLHQGSLDFSYLESFGDALSLDGNSQIADVDMDDWKLFGVQSPQCVSHDQQAGLGTALRTSHDDLCAHPPKCPTGGHYSSNSSNHHGLYHGGNSASAAHMLFHTRHFDPSVVSSGHSGQNQRGMQGIPTTVGGTQGSALNLMDFTTGGSFFIPSSVGPSAPDLYSPTYANDFAEQLSVLSSPPTQHSMHSGAADDGADDDEGSTCGSDCDADNICRDTACAINPSGCCEDEDCQGQSDTGSVIAALSPEDADAAAALTSFIEQQQQGQIGQQQEQQQQQRQQQEQQQQQQMPVPSCLQFGLGQDITCISPQFLINYQHLRDSHNPLNPSECTASVCPVEDPSFYQECHMRHFTDCQGGLFDNLDLNQIMNENAIHGHGQGLSHVHSHNHVDAVECGAKFPSGEAMLQHLWNEHRKSLNLLQFPAMQQNLQMDQTPDMASSASPSASLVSQDLARTPSLPQSGQDVVGGGLTLPDSSLPLRTFGFDSLNDAAIQKHLQDPAMTSPQITKQLTQLQLPATPGLKTENSQQKIAGGAVDTGPQMFECAWCDTLGGQPCGQSFDSACELHKHVLAAHTHLLKRDVGGTYSCGWQGCTRRDSEEKGGFAQKSKIDRHMQVHTGNKPFTCDICHQSFSANQALLQHKLIHEDSKPLSCDICGKTFRQHSALTMHIRTHTKVRPLKCPYCNKEFSESSNLSKHKRIHTGDGQYECKFPGCNRTFHRKDQLRRHSGQHSKSTSSSIAKPAANSSLVAKTVAV
ncbi:hypothetical protein HMPREF1624_01468 [Sporothrix schenckii ATCC 58251]|uniref:C2H2-type domain-containing protein n=1 Tax=Sporothrix schenckii (strain ATCC 58251 / de Perez 2211183) TaxID=1391915 RepID=U7Q5Q0_SPOS1|nr:hypothetical protein HMPREF1624_01468 [Sporothrix schenckii ATCC 58251]